MPNGARFIAVIHFASRLNENPRGLNRARAGCLLLPGFRGCFFNSPDPFHHLCKDLVDVFSR